jgi:uncharacterized protein
MLSIRMWIDQRGSEVLSRPECLRLLAMAGQAGTVGHLAVSTDTAPVVHPVNFSFEDGRVLLRLGHGFMLETSPGRLVAFEVDGADPARQAGREAGGTMAWSVLVRGLLTPVAEGTGPRPLVPRPGDDLMSIRPDVVSGRRFRELVASEGS